MVRTILRAAAGRGAQAAIVMALLAGASAAFAQTQQQMEIFQ
jgi:hypothetical protein